MTRFVDVDICVVIPNWNGSDSIKACLDSLLSQSIKTNIIVVDNGSVDSSVDIIKKYKDIELIQNNKNKGFAGGVNVGIKKALDYHYRYIALLNNDAIADKNWIANLTACMKKDRSVGIAAAKLLDGFGQSLDSTGEYYTVWGLPYPRGRHEEDINKYDNKTSIFAASGGASLYRVSMLEQVGLFDESFFAYYEDVDLSFRAQLSGWKVKYVPSAVVYHQIGATSSKVRGFTTYQTMKNLPLLFIKNVPKKYLFKIGWRLRLALILFFISSIKRWQAWPAFRGAWMSVFLTPKALIRRKSIQNTRVVPDEYIWSMIVHDLPPNARSLRKLRSTWWKLRGRS